jgi:glucokinase
VTGAVEVVARMEAGDQLAREVWHEGVAALARGLDAATTLLDPEIIVLGGGLARAGSRLADDVRAGLADRLTFQPVPEVTTAQLGDEAGGLGAALLALDRWGPDVTGSAAYPVPVT